MKLRAGAYGLSLLSDPLDSRVLQALGQRSLTLLELRRTVGSPPDTTLRKHLKTLAGLGILVRLCQDEFPGAVSYELSPSGRELLYGVDVLSAWLSAAPAGPLQIGTPAAKSAIRALVEGWTTRVLRALAAKPLSLTELDRLLAGINYPALERRLAAMRLAGQIIPAPRRTASTPYRVTRWSREAIRPLAAAASWELHNAPDNSEPLSRLDVETIFLLAVPLLCLPSGPTGACRLIVEMSAGPASQLTGAGIVVALDRGRPVSCASDLKAQAASSAAASVTVWLDTLSGRANGVLEINGDRNLGDAVVGGLLRALALQEGDAPTTRSATTPESRKSLFACAPNDGAAQTHGPEPDE